MDQLSVVSLFEVSKAGGFKAHMDCICTQLTAPRGAAPAGRTLCPCENLRHTPLCQPRPSLHSRTSRTILSAYPAATKASSSPTWWAFQALAPDRQIGLGDEMTRDLSPSSEFSPRLELSLPTCFSLPLLLYPSSFFPLLSYQSLGVMCRTLRHSSFDEVICNYYLWLFQTGWGWVLPALRQIIAW